MCENIIYLLINFVHKMYKGGLNAKGILLRLDTFVITMILFHNKLMNLRRNESEVNRVI